MQNFTVLSTKTAFINGKKAIVETITSNARAQAIAYRIGNKVLTGEKFWAMQPKFAA